MAKMLNSINLEVRPTITVDLETARVCVKLVNWFLEANEDWRLSIVNGGDHAEYALTDEPVMRSAVIPADRESVEHYRKLAGLEDDLK